MVINSIIVKNVKGIDSREIKGPIYPNVPTFIVATNGTGKTSFATAFNSLKSNKIELNKKDYREEDKNNRPSISIFKDFVEFVADDTKNELSNTFDIYVINNMVKSKVINHNINGQHISSSIMSIDPIVFYEKIPEKASLLYSFKEQKNENGENVSKIITNLTSEINKSYFIDSLLSNKIRLEKLCGKRNKIKLSEFIKNINEIKSTKSEILNNCSLYMKNLDINLKNEINDLYSSFFKNSTLENSEIVKFVDVIQVSSVYCKNKANLTKIGKYNEYLQDYKSIKEITNCFNSTWRNIAPVVEKNKLVISFPETKMISNGERDILCFVSELLLARKKLQKENCILIIDEIFDYLDDANLIAAQYFLSSLMQEFKKNKNLFILLMTHINPEYFSSYCFKTSNIVYMNEVHYSEDKYGLNLLLKDRDDCKKNSKEIYRDISSNYLHYSNKENGSKDYLDRMKVRKEIQSSEDFFRISIEELRKYAKNENYNNYYPSMVCCGLRLLIERIFYEKIANIELRKEFISIDNGTKERLNFCQSNGVNVPEIMFLLSIIYNDAMHLDSSEKKLIPISNKLNNKVIHNMIDKAYDYLINDVDEINWFCGT